VIHQPGLLWRLDPQTGYFGLLKNKRAVLALTSGAYGPSMPSPAFGIDHHSFSPTATGSAAMLVPPERRGYALWIVVAGLTLSTALVHPLAP
jgi:hypothetical protein